MEKGKGEKYYWLKLKKDFFKRHDIQIVEAMPNGKDYILFYLKLMCESVDHEGRLRFSDEIPYNETMLATITNTNVSIVRDAVKLFTELHMMEIMDDGTFFMNEVDKLIGSAANNDNANRQRRFRENHKDTPLLERYESVTKCNADVTEAVTEDNESIEIEKEIEKDNIYCRAEDSPTEHPEQADVTEIVKYLNQAAGTSYKPNTPKTVRSIKARMKEGFTVDDFKTVIDKKVSEWAKTDMQKYIRPETLFGTKFEGYLNQQITKGKAPPGHFLNCETRNYSKEDFEELERIAINGS